MDVVGKDEDGYFRAIRLYDVKLISINEDVLEAETFDLFIKRDFTLCESGKYPLGYKRKLYFEITGCSKFYKMDIDEHDEEHF